MRRLAAALALMFSISGAACAEPVFSFDSTPGRLPKTVVPLRYAVELKPDYADAYNNLGNALRGCGRLDEAIAAYRRSIELKPDNADAYGNLAITFKDLGRLEESIASHRHAVALRPGFRFPDADQAGPQRRDPRGVGTTGRARTLSSAVRMTG